MSTFAEAPAGDAAKGAKIFKTKYVHSTVFKALKPPFTLHTIIVLFSSHNLHLPDKFLQPLDFFNYIF
jgi:hypothetical protein